MFTGLVRECGRLIADPRPSGQGGKRLSIAHSRGLGDVLSIGDSLAVAGVCLTLVDRDATRSDVELAPETLRRTTLGGLRVGDRVNLEPALRAGEPLGGHLVQGHVDTTVRVVARRDLGDHRELGFALPATLQPTVVEKGSVTLDGVSLTVAGLAADRFTVALIPHTLEVTTLDALAIGDRVNLEVDVLGKYVQRALELRWQADGPPVDR